jgi:O-antigen/teichoic acid export membrane protein
MVSRQQTLRALFWSATDRFAAQALQFGMGLILARLLMPADYGLMGMIMIFLAISQSFVDSGFPSALIQKKNRTEIDYSTVFWFNVFISTVFYLILFILAPTIANFYNEPKLTILTRFVALNIIFSSFSIVRMTRLTIELNFKTQAKASLLSLLIGGFLGVYLAYAGYGVWALAAQSLAKNLLNVIFLWWFSKWNPLFAFSKEAFLSMFSFGSKILGVGLLRTFFDNIYIVIIGKIYSPAELGYYTRAIKFQQLPSKNISEILYRVLFPVLTNFQDNNQILLKQTKRAIKVSSFIVFPLMFGLAAISDPLIRFILGEKWLPLVPLLRLLCIAGVFYPLQHLNLTILMVKGRSDIFLRLEIISKVLIIFAIIFTFSFGLTALVIGQVVTMFMIFSINAYYTGKVLSYGFFSQIQDMIYTALTSSLMALLVYCIIGFFSADWIKLLVGVTVGITSYIFFAISRGSEEFIELKKLFFMKNR